MCCSLEPAVPDCPIAGSIRACTAFGKQCEVSIVKALRTPGCAERPPDGNNCAAQCCDARNPVAPETARALGLLPSPCAGAPMRWSNNGGRPAVFSQFVSSGQLHRSGRGRLAFSRNDAKATFCDGHHIATEPAGLGIG